MRWLLAAVFVISPCAAAFAQNDHKQILALYATRRDSQFSLIGERELPRILDEGLARSLDYYAEFIDLARFPDLAYQEGFRNFLRLKYQGVRFDLVIAMHDAAIEFVGRHGEAVFPGTPAVFLRTSPAARPRNSTGLIHHRDFGSTVALIRRLQPDVRQVFVVTGAGVAEMEYEKAARQQLEASGTGLRFVYLSGLPTKELQDRLSTLPAQSAVYYLLVTRDGDGNRFHPLEYIARVVAAANAPVYCWVDAAMDRGIVGGSLYSQRDAVTRLGELALRVLRGEAADGIAIEVVDLNTNQVDWRQLRRWKIDEARVPAGTLVLFRDPTLWDRYKAYVLAALAVLVTQTLLITGLLIQAERRRRAEKDLRRSESELRRSSERNRDLGARLLRAQETERSRIARELHDDICQRMLLLTIELESLDSAHGGEAPAAAALTAARDIAKSLHELSHQLHPTRLRVIGLTAALERLCLELSRTGFAISFTHERVPATLAPDVTLCLFRVVQEALQNSIKYSNGRSVSVHLRGGPAGLTLTIADDGVGFDVNAAMGRGVGLVSMVERVEAAGGSLDIRSGAGAGTRVTATMPPPALQSTESIPLENVAAS